MPESPRRSKPNFTDLNRIDADDLNLKIAGTGRGERRFFVLMTLLCVAGLVVLSLGHPSGYGWMPRCPFYVLTGLYCPGCGSLRATHYLLHGNLIESMRNHPLFVPMLFFIFLFYGKRLYELYKGQNVTFRGEMLLAKIILIVFVFFFFVRNIPISALDWTRPPSVSNQRAGNKV